MALAVGSSAAFAQPYVPPSAFGDEHQGNCVLRKEVGQTLDTDGNQRPDIKAYFENTPLGIWLREKSTVSFTLAVMHPDSITPDTVYRVDLKLSKNRLRDPNPMFLAPGIANFYKGAMEAEDVKAHYRRVYESVADSIDVHFFGGLGGPRIAWVVRPGGDPSDISLSFVGQDSLGIDWEGDLKIYLADKWIELKEALAYQVDGNGNLVPVNWTGGYTHEEGSANAGFTFEDYNPALPLVLQVGYPPLPGGGGPDPRNMDWSTYVNASDGDELQSVEVDADGNPYVCGFAFQQYFPITTGSMVFPPFIGEPSGAHNATVTKFNHTNKQIVWATYYGGGDNEGIGGLPRTDANKLAVYSGPHSEYDYVFVTGSTNCVDFSTIGRPETVFEDAFVEPFGGGNNRMWLGAFLKETGVRDWATTHGETDNTRTWSEHGLAIDVGPHGLLVVGGKIETFFDPNTTPDFPRVTPTGAFTRALGDGFFILFDEDYQIEWSSTFCEFSSNEGLGGVMDLRVTKKNTELANGVWLVGSSVDRSGQTFDLVPPPTGGYYQEEAGYLSSFVAFLNLTTYELEYSTRWGSPDANTTSIGAAYGICETPGSMWVVGFTDAFDLTETELPPPPSGPGGAHWSETNYSTDQYQVSEGFILRYDISDDGYVLDYGTLIGGTRADVLLDVNTDGAGKVYITGETRSSYGFMADLDPQLYYQPQHNYTDRRDAFILGIEDDPYPLMFWRTAFGGTRSERGWGIAASPAEVYLCGTTASDEGDAFPLLEFNTDPNDPESELDYFFRWFYGGSADIMVPWRVFRLMMDYEWNNFDIQVVESYSLPQDGFITSFYMGTPVGVPPAFTDAIQDLLVWPMDDGCSYMVRTPRASHWQGSVVDAAGRIVAQVRFTGQITTIQLKLPAASIYLLQVRDVEGNRYSAKFLTP